MPKPDPSVIDVDVSGTDLTTKDRYDPAVLAKAYEMFLHTDLDLIDISIALAIPKSVVAHWSRKGQWAKRKEELELELVRAAENKYREFLIKHKLPTVERHLRVASKLENEVEHILDENKNDLGSAELRRLSETLASSSTVSARAIGLADKTVERAIAADTAPVKPPLVPMSGPVMPMRATETTVTRTVEFAPDTQGDTPCHDIVENGSHL